MTVRLSSWVGVCLLCANFAQGQFTVSLEPVPGQVVTGNAVIAVEAFIRNDGADFLIRGIQVDLPCSLPGKPGSSGTAMTVGANPLSVGNTSAAASGSVPWVYASVAPNDGVTGCGGAGCSGGLRPIAQTFCRLSGSPGPGEPSYILPGAGARRYIGTFRYTVSTCAAGTFNIPYEVMNMPCLNTDLTRVVQDNNTCADANFVAGAITVEVGQCCQGQTCLSDGINRTCCVNQNPGANFTVGFTCSDPCECQSNADCPSNFCVPRRCNLQTGTCENDPPPVCPGGSACVDAVCDPSANGGAGGCTIVSRPAGSGCGNSADTACDNPDTCNANGNCVNNAEPAGTPCGSSANTDCDNPDTCNGSGMCSSNPEPNGLPCTSDSNDCTDDVCQGGTCGHLNDNTNSCSDGVNCTQNDRCTNGTCQGDPVDANDGLICTLDFCDEATGSAVNIDINTIPCLTDADCPGVACGAGRCVCFDNPELELRPRKDINGANCHDEGEHVFVDVYFGGTPATLCIAGGSFRVEYDPTCLDFVSAVPGAVPWRNEIFEQVDEAGGVLFYAVGSPIGGGGLKCSNMAGIMATFEFIKIGDCNECDLCLTTVNPQHTRLTTAKGQEVLPEELGCTKPIFDVGVVTSTCPGSFVVNSDCLKTTAVVTWPPIRFVDECDGVLPHTCTCQHQPLPGRPAINCNGLANAGGTFPQGHYSFVCAVEDEECNDGHSCSWELTVTDDQSLDVRLQLSPVVGGNEITRCICFELISSCTPLVVEEVCKTIAFGGPFDFRGQASTEVKVPKGKYVCIQARDRQHSIRSIHFPLTCDGVSYAADFKGDPFFGGNWLIQGNLNQDELVDILDFGMFLGQLNQNPNPGPNKVCEGGLLRHADFNGDGRVDVVDYTFIQINFLANDKDDCCHNPTAGGRTGRTEVSVKELLELGMEEIAVADLNEDGLVNTEDMAAFVSGARPKPIKAVRDGAGRRGSVRGSR